MLPGEDAPVRPDAATKLPPGAKRLLAEHPSVLVAYLRGPGLIVEHLNSVGRAIATGIPALGRPLEEVSPRTYAVLAPALRQVHETLERVELRSFHVPLRGTRPGVERYFTIALDPVLSQDGAVEGILAVAFETTGAVRAEARAEVFARMISELATDVDLGAVVRTSLDRAIELLGGDDGAIWLLEGERMRCVYEAPEAGRLGVSASGTASERFWKGLHERVPFYLEARDAPEAERAWFDRLGVKASLVLPLAADASVLGALVVSDRIPRARAPSDLAFGRAVAAQCALAIQRARAAGAERVARERLQHSQHLTAALAATRTVDEVIAAVLEDGLAAFGAAGGAVVLAERLDPAGLRLAGARGYPEEILRHFQRIPLDAPLPIAAAARERTPVWLGSPAERDAAFPAMLAAGPTETRSWAAIPLVVDQRCLAVVGLSFRHEQAFTADVREEMLSHARKCAQALDRVQLDEALRVERAHLLSVLDALPAGIAVADQGGRVVAMNAAMRPFAPREAGPVGESAFDAAAWSASHLDGRPVAPSELPLARALSGERVERMELRVGKPGGGHAVLSVSAAPIHDREGDLDGAVTAAWDVTAQKETESALRTATVALDVANRQKDQFLAMLAHELRNPLAAIRSAAHVIRARAAQGRSPEHAVEILERQAGNAARLLDDLLDVSRITRGLVDLRSERVRLDEVVTSAVESQRALVDRLGHRLTVRMQGGVVVDGDPTRLEQIVANLLNNAVKYSSPGGRIEVELDVTGARARLRVADQGHGIAPELLPRIFELFVQGETGLARTAGGLGLGLTLVKRLVELHGGTITARSEGPGRGSTFEVILPLASAATLTPLPRGPWPASGPAPTQRVLVVEDNPDAAETLVEVLKLLGHEARWAADGPSALALADRFAPDVVLLDIGLPDMDGYEIARRLRASERGPALRIVAVSGYAQEEDQQRAREAGFDQHLRKPVEPASLASAIAAAAHPH